jgi:hypothetical protein
VRYETSVEATRAVLSSIAAAYASGSGSTRTISAPRSSCAWAIWPIVGNSFSEMTIRFRSPRNRSAETSPLTAADTDVWMATSSGAAPRSAAKAARAVSERSTQCPHSAPFSSHPSRYSSYAARTASESAPCEHELR